MSEEKLSFQAEVSKLLSIVAHSLYSDKEIFLRELISNASDACDKLRYEALTNEDLLAGDGEFKIKLTVDKEAGTISIADNGIGMNREDLINNLGTIARSGTGAFVDALTGDSKKDMALIGQFGVGFYSSFMVSDKVEVVTKRAGDDQAWKWISDGQGEFTVSEAEKDSRGMTATLFLNDESKEYLEFHRIQQVVRTYSDHIAIPILMDRETEEGEGDEKKKVITEETLNTASALWTRSKSDINEDQYKEFYHHVGHVFDDPWLTLHNTVEGVIEYTNLLFIPTSRPMDIFHPDRKQNVKLYVKRVFITDNCDELLPPYLRFVRGVVDAQDLPLNISREMLQNNPVLSKIKLGLVKRILGELKKKADKKPEEYATFWEAFGAVIKEGVYEDFTNRDALLDICRFKSTNGDDLVSLEDYMGRMKEGQEAIYYITGEDVSALRNSPQLEGFAAKGIEVLLLSDSVDEFWVSAIGIHKEKPFKSVTKGGADLDKIKSEEKEADDKKEDESTDTEALDRLIAAMKVALGEDVKDVRKSNRLTGSAVCLVADENDMDMHLQRMLAQHGQSEAAASKRILEINDGHDVIEKLKSMAEKDGTSNTFVDASKLLFDQACIVEGEKIQDPAAFARRLSSVMASGLSL
ncbi:MAG: molecular chaperone HtpG [Alphaproteobacteria bacterium]|nr:molecular chaperone HtpG [Alphaproteobacteria bacterium]